MLRATTRIAEARGVRRASILLEVLLAIAIFAFSGVVVLGVLNETVAAGARAQRRALAMDVARSRMAEIEAGVTDEGEADVAGGAGGAGGASTGDPAADPRMGLRVTERTEPSEFPNLLLATVEVWDDRAPPPTAIAQALGSSESSAPRLAVLRQLVRAPNLGGAP